MLLVPEPTCIDLRGGLLIYLICKSSVGYSKFFSTFVYWQITLSACIPMQYLKCTHLLMSATLGVEKASIHPPCQLRRHLASNHLVNLQSLCFHTSKAQVPVDCPHVYLQAFSTPWYCKPNVCFKGLFVTYAFEYLYCFQAVFTSPRSSSLSLLSGFAVAIVK